MQTSIRISSAEWQVMKLIWDKHPRTAREIIVALEPDHSWNSRTIRTLIGRLVRKGAVKAEEDGRRYLYSPAISRAHCLRRESRQFVERVFGGVPASMLLHLVKHSKLSKKEIQELKKLLEEKEE